MSAPRVLILAGGLGTRLASVLTDRPKVLAPIADRPFLDILVEELARAGLHRMVLLLGSRHEQVAAHVASGRWPAGVDFEFSVEPAPLGTGGAVKLAQRFCGERFFLVNGDTFFDVDVAALQATHQRTGALLTLAAAAVDAADRFGRLDLSADGLVEAFREKDAGGGTGLINAGFYLVEPALLAHIEADKMVSLERDVFPTLLAGGKKIAASPQTGAFFDIGTPSSLRRFIDYRQGRSRWADPSIKDQP